MTNKPMRVFIGFDPREAAAYDVAKASIRHFDRHIMINGVVLSLLRAEGLYTRPTRRRLGRLWDEISQHEMSTEFANSRFLVPEICRRQDWHGWALFMDCDVLVRANLQEMRQLLDDEKAVMCVKHNHAPANLEKMDGQKQSRYERKNWSSVMAFNIDHPANAELTVEMVNTLPGRDLHRFCWLTSDEIGALPEEWNVLIGHSKVEHPKIAHFTDGGPWLEAFRDVPYADEWFSHLERWAA